MCRCHPDSISVGQEEESNEDHIGNCPFNAGAIVEALPYVKEQDKGLWVVIGQGWFDVGIDRHL